MRRASLLLAAGAALGLSAAPVSAAEGQGPMRLPGWDEASTSAGCLAMSAWATQMLPGDRATPAAGLGEGGFWSARLNELAPEFGERLEYWEAAHEWLEEELRRREPEAARAFLSEYRGRCAMEQATLTTEHGWGMAQ